MNQLQNTGKMLSKDFKKKLKGEFKPSTPSSFQMNILKELIVIQYDFLIFKSKSNGLSTYYI